MSTRSEGSEVSQVPQDLETLETLRMTKAFRDAMQAEDKALQIRYAEARTRYLATWIICLIIMGIGTLCVMDYISKRDAELQEQIMRSYSVHY